MSYRGQLNHFKQKGFISEPAFLECGNFQYSVTVKLVGTSQDIVGNGSLENTKASAKESAAKDACNKIQEVIGNDTGEHPNNGHVGEYHFN